jgi:hypothetical protein
MGCWGASHCGSLKADVFSDSPRLCFLKTLDLIEQRHFAFDEICVFTNSTGPDDEIICNYWEPGGESAFAPGMCSLNKFLRRHSFLTWRKFSLSAYR